MNTQAAPAAQASHPLKRLFKHSVAYQKTIALAFMYSVLNKLFIWRRPY